MRAVVVHASDTLTIFQVLPKASELSTQSQLPDFTHNRAVEAVARRRRAFDSFTSAAVRDMKKHLTAKAWLRRYLAEIGTNHLEGKKYL